ncbi:MAG TPA: DUF1841 family protein [Casimicrobiaceae bacterium]|nr:DUF1841 family protein [Casimicrobiaceae bacterium]
MFAPSRDEARRFLVDAWTKFRAGQALSALETRVAEIVSLHPEYHAMLEHADRHLDRDWRPDEGTMNPFLHLSLHLAVAEQIAIDQPIGIRAQYERLKARADEHDALHAVVECLGEVMWQAQRTQTAPDGELYLDCLRKR